MNTTERITAAWAQDRAYLRAVASRILADPVEAEDVVQDAFARLSVQPIDEIADVRAWLVVVVRRAALDRLGSARRRRSDPRDPHDLELASESTSDLDPADRVTLDDEVRRALTIVLDRLSPAERSAFLLHDVFGVSFDQIAELVGRTPAACRQLARRARQAIAADDADLSPAYLDRDVVRVAERFRAACVGGDVSALIETLDADVSGWALVNGRQVGFATGAQTVAERAMLFLGPDSRWDLTLMPLDDAVAILATRRAEPAGLLRLEIADGRVTALRAVVLPS